ncbi:hypothetical protein AZ19_1725 [Bordetella bronchiseptica E012]|uniref:hypothetical protein n=1 Tax=Bordetella bronchiseptica TaxID=518 RepID=UPI000460AF4E|nr:hypothetical protein [Bordetella bronchiseptica]KDC12333.1 hypothetical protein AZ19_1725 [Bordetella bronchiseptica E012]
MSTFANLGIPDLPERAFRRGASGRILPQGGKGSAPKAPNYESLAREQSQAQLQLAREAAQANRVNQVTPYGSLTWSNNRTFDQSGYDRAMQAYTQAMQAYGSSPSQPTGRAGAVWNDSFYDPGSSTTSSLNGSAGASRGPGPVAPNINDFYTGGDQWTQSMQFSPEIQKLYANVLQQMGTPFDLSSLPQAGSAYDPNLATNNATELLMERLNPELDRQYESLRAQMANQGIAQGSNAYSRELSRFGEQRNDAANQAALAGIGLGMQQQGLTFNQMNQLRNQAMQEQSYVRGLPLSEFNALLGGSSSMQFPGYAQQATTGAPDLVGAAGNTYKGDLGAYNAGQMQRQGMMGGLSQIGGAAGSYFGGPLGGLLGRVGGGLLGGLFG